MREFGVPNNHTTLTFVFYVLHLCIVEFNFTSPVRNVTLSFDSKRSQHQHRCLGHDTHDRCRSGVSDFHMFCFVLSPRDCIQKEPLFLLQVSHKLWTFIYIHYYEWHIFVYLYIRIYTYVCVCVLMIIE